MHPRARRWMPTLLVAAGLLLAGGLSSTAQDATPMTGASGHVHPAHIHLGTCDELDPNPPFPLSDVTPAPGDTDAPTEGATAIPVERSVTTVDAALDDLQSGGYAINVHQSVEDIGTYIACGSLSGSIDTGSGAGQSASLVVGLRELNDSGHSGLAILQDQGEQTDVIVYLAEGLSGDAGAMTAGDNAEVAVGASQVDIRDFTYIPDQIEIPVGATVTWTNSDSAPHTATAQDRSALQSGTLNQGDSFSQTFTKPGAYDYFCEFHPNMKGTIVVQ